MGGGHCKSEFSFERPRPGCRFAMVMILSLVALAPAEFWEGAGCSTGPKFLLPAAGCGSDGEIIIQM